MLAGDSIAARWWSTGRHRTEREGTAKKVSCFRNCRTFGAARDLANDPHPN
jgi:hypothetical protein